MLGRAPIHPSAEPKRHASSRSTWRGHDRSCVDAAASAYAPHALVPDDRRVANRTGGRLLQSLVRASVVRFGALDLFVVPSRRLGESPLRPRCGRAGTSQPALAARAGVAHDPTLCAHGEPDAVKVAPPVRRAAARKPPAESPTLAPRRRPCARAACVETTPFTRTRHSADASRSP